MSDTPRTDAAKEEYLSWCAYSKQYAHIPEAQDQAPPEADPFWISANLEKELTAANQEIQRLREAIEKAKSQEFFHDGLVGDLSDVPDKAHAYVLGWEDCVQEISEALNQKEDSK